MKLSDATVKNAKPKDKPYKLFDGGGLYLEVMPITKRNLKGSKLWRLKYRYAGKEKRISLGRYPVVTLGIARAKSIEAKQRLEENIDPSAAKFEDKMMKNVSSANTFEAIAKEWLIKKEKEVKASTLKNIQDTLENNLFPSIGKLPIKSVTAPVLIQALKPVEKRAALDMVKRLRQYSGQIFRFAIANGKAEYNPAPDIIDALQTRPVEHFKAMPLEVLPEFLRKLDSNEARLFKQTTLALKLMVLTFTRKAELSHAKWEEVNFKDEVWIVPAERAKMKREHIVPLSRQALAIFEELRMVSGNREHVFPGIIKPNQPIHEDTTLRALYRLGYKNIATIHGFRSLAMTTIMEVLGYRYEVPDLQLAHSKGDKIRAAYDRTKFLDERTKMMQDWADYVDKIKEAK